MSRSITLSVLMLVVFTVAATLAMETMTATEAHAEDDDFVPCFFFCTRH